MQQSFFLCDTQEKLLLCKGKGGFADAKPPSYSRRLRVLLHSANAIVIEVIGFTSVIRTRIVLNHFSIFNFYSIFLANKFFRPIIKTICNWLCKLGCCYFGKQVVNIIYCIVIILNINNDCLFLTITSVYGDPFILETSVRHHTVIFSGIPLVSCQNRCRWMNCVEPVEGIRGVVAVMA